MIEIIGLTKYYGKLAAVVNMNLKINEGDIFGFIGPNGAGKTTTMRVLATLLKPTTGRATIDGADVLRDGQKVRRLVGYMPDFMGVYDDLKVYEYLEFFAAAFSVPRAKRRQIIEGVLELTDLTGKKSALVDSLSRGMQQRLQLARVLIHDPKVLILDEPASGLDPRARIELRELLRELKTMGKTIMISSHILSELEEMCDHVGIIEHGSLVFSGTMQEIHTRLGANRKIRIRVGTDPQQACELLVSLPFVDAVDKTNEHITVTLKDGSDTVSLDNPNGAADDPLTGTTAKANVAAIAKSLVTAGVDLLELSPERVRLDEAFLRLTQGLVH